MAAHDTPKYLDITIEPEGLGTVKVHYIEAGSPDLPTLVLLHGFPSSTTQFRDFIPLLSSKYHVVAPDLPGFGLTEISKDFGFTFDNLTAVVDAWLKALKISSYVPYVFDYGAPIVWRLAQKNPSSIKAIISQNGNAYDEGFGQDFWQAIFNLWNTENSSEARQVLINNVLTLGTTKFQYVAGVPEKDLDLINPAQWTTDYLMNIAGDVNQQHQLDLFFDYRKNKEMYPQVHEYFRKHKPAVLAVWGKNDPAFIYPGAEAFKKDLPDAEVVLLDAGHFALETKRWEVADEVLKFLKKIGY